MQKTDERDELRRLKAQNRDLKNALADAHLDLRIEKEYYNMVCEASNIEPEEFKKKVNLN